MKHWLVRKPVALTVLIFAVVTMTLIVKTIAWPFPGALLFATQAFVAGWEIFLITRP